MKYFRYFQLQGRQSCRYLHHLRTRTAPCFTACRLPRGESVLRSGTCRRLSTVEEHKTITVRTTIGVTMNGKGSNTVKMVETPEDEGASASANPTEEAVGEAGNGGSKSSSAKKKRRRKKGGSGSEKNDNSKTHQEASGLTPQSSSTPTKPHGGRQSRAKHSEDLRKSTVYESYWSKEGVQRKLQDGIIYAGVLRINPNNYKMAWVSVPGFKYDVLLKGRLMQNRALPGDLVCIKLDDRKKWVVLEDRLNYHEDMMSSSQLEQRSEDDTSAAFANLNITGDEVKEEEVSISEDNNTSNEKSEPDVTEGKEGSPTAASTATTPHRKAADVSDEFLQPTGRVVYILEKKHSRVAAGYLKPFSSSDHQSALFTPCDSKLPRLRIAKEFCPEGFFKRPKDFEKTLLIAKITDWQDTSPSDMYLAEGYIARSLGNAGEIEPETEAILLEYGIDTGPYPEKALACLPSKRPWTIPKKEYDNRRDFRNDCVFTIDPSTARDLDDAVHCKQLSDGTYEIGVHIADVSYFVKQGTSLDQAAYSRATSTYMVQKVIPMLPELLCEELCSLNPDQERLTFSVVWKMTADGEILDEWMGKGIIKSCVKMAYEHAQDIIEHPKKQFKTEELPPISKAFTIPDIVQSVLTLNRMARQMRQKRFDNGALSITMPKLHYALDGETGMPNGFQTHVQRESNQLIEEFMLLANMAVAVQIYTTNPDTALLRCHPSPDPRMLEDLAKLSEDLGLEFKSDTSKQIKESLQQFAPSSPEHMILSNYAMKSMMPAQYFCTGKQDEEKYMHYALSVPFYTHFTSPIRRYADIIVHRQLASGLGIEKPSKYLKDMVAGVAGQCNDKKQAAKLAGERSSALFFSVFLRESGSLEGEGMVSAVLNSACDVIIPEFGLVKRCHFNKDDENIKEVAFTKRSHLCPPHLVVTWNVKDEETKEDVEVKQVLDIFTQVKVLLKPKEDSLESFAKLIPPKTWNGKVKVE